MNEEEKKQPETGEEATPTTNPAADEANSGEQGEKPKFKVTRAPMKIVGGKKVEAKNKGTRVPMPSVGGEPKTVRLTPRTDVKADAAGGGAPMADDSTTGPSAKVAPPTPKREMSGAQASVAGQERDKSSMGKLAVDFLAAAVAVAFGVLMLQKIKPLELWWNF